MPNNDRKHLKFWTILKHAKSGVPVTTRGLSVPWTSIRTPFFPLAFTLISIGLYGVAFISGNLRFGYSVSQLTLLTLEAASEQAVVLIGINLALLSWLMFVLFISKYVARKSVSIVAGACRTTYFSTFFQPMMVFAFTIIFSDSLSKLYELGGSGFALVLVPKILGIIYVLLFCIIGLAAAGRFVYVFQGIKQETDDSLTGLFALLGCFDAWYYLYLGVSLAYQAFIG